MMLSRLRIWLTLHRFVIIRIFWILISATAICLVIFLVYPPLLVYWPVLGRNLAKLSVIAFCLSLGPGILKRFQAGPKLQNLELSLMLFRRQFGIAMYLFALFHFIFSRLAPVLKYHGNLLPLSPFEIFGMLAFFLTTPLFLTANNYSQHKLGRRWRWLHRIVYLIIWLTLFHVLLQHKFGTITFILGITAVLEIASFFKGVASVFIASVLSLLLAYLIFGKSPLPYIGTLSNQASPSATVASLNPASPYTLAAVAAHKTASDCWTVISGKVYNISAYIPFHPGGQDTILSACGVDATVAFNSKGGRGRSHLPSTLTLLAQYYLADLNASAAAPPASGSANISTNPPVIPTYPVPPTPSPFPKGSSGTSLTTATVASHNSQSDCWLIIGGKVYNVTSYIPYHPGGTQQIISRCGTDATTAFNNRGGTGSHSQNAQSLLQNYLIGSIGSTTNITNPTGASTPPTLAPTSPPATPLPTANPGTVLTSSVVAQHHTQTDCWLIISNKVYNVTAYIPFHPGGTQRIVNVCGQDATTAFDTRGGTGSHSTTARNLLANYYLGDLNSTSTGGGTSPSATPNPSSPTATPTSGTSSDSIQAAILAQYPGANITEINHEDNGYVVHFIYNGHEYEATLNSSYVITSVK